MNLFKRFFCILTCCFLQTIYAQIPTIITKKYPASALKEDALVFKNIVLKMHPAVGIYENRAHITQLFDNLIADLSDSLTEKQFRIKLKFIADELRCGHTEVAASLAYFKAFKHLKINFSPYYFIPVQNKLFVLASLNRKQDTLLKVGTEVKRINGITIDTSFGLIRKMISTDGYNLSGKNYYLQRGFNAYHFALFSRPDTMEIEFLKSDSTTFTKRIKAIKLENLPPFPLQKREDSLYTKYRRAAMSFRYLDAEKSTMHLRIHSFSAWKYKKAYRKIFRQLEKNKTENLVIDLRNNGGGSLTNSYRLLEYILNEQTQQTLKTGIRKYPFKQYTRASYVFKLTRWGLAWIGKHKKVNDTDYYTYTIKPSRKRHYNGKLLVLINGGSFSASCLTAAYIQHQKRGQFIGQETSGALEGCNAGVTPFYTLPNTKIRLRIPTFRVIHDPITQLTGKGIQPDYPIEYQFKDIMGKKDLELLKAKELLRIK